QFGTYGHTATIMVPMSPRSLQSSRGPFDAGPGVLTRVDLRGRTGDFSGLLPAPETVDDESTNAVSAILDQVKFGGDGAIRELTWKYDGAVVDDLRVPADEVRAALDEIPAALRAAIEAAHDNIVAYHRTQLAPDREHQRQGVVVRDVGIAVSRAGL